MTIANRALTPTYVEPTWSANTAIGGSVGSGADTPVTLPCPVVFEGDTVDLGETGNK